jgi:hypothetical protein
MPEEIFNESGELNVEALSDEQKASVLNYGKDNWRGLFSEEFSTSAITADIPDLETLGKNYTNAQSLVGKKGIIKPAENAGDDAWNTYHKSMGRPDDSAGYDLDELEGMSKDLDMTTIKDDFQKKMFESNVDNKSANTAWNYVQELINNGQQSGTEEYQQRISTEQKALDKEWGLAKSEKIELAKSVLAKFADDDTRKFFVQSGLNKEPKIAKFLASVGAELSEDSLKSNAIPNGIPTPQEAEARIDKIISENEIAYYDKMNPNHDSLAAQVVKLRKYADGMY